MDKPVSANIWSCSCFKNGSAWSAERPPRRTKFLAAAFFQKTIKLKLILLLRYVHMDNLPWAQKRRRVAGAQGVGHMGTGLQGCTDRQRRRVKRENTKKV